MTVFLQIVKMPWTVRPTHQNPVLESLKLGPLKTAHVPAATVQVNKKHTCSFYLHSSLSLSSFVLVIVCTKFYVAT